MKKRKRISNTRTGLNPHRGGKFLLALLVGALILLLQGENPIEVYRYLLIDPLISKNGLLKVLGKATPLIFTGLAATLAFRCNVFNIGLEGQLYAGALTAAVLGYMLQGLPAWLHLTICFNRGNDHWRALRFYPSVAQGEIWST